MRVRFRPWLTLPLCIACFARTPSEAACQTATRTWISLESALLAQASDLAVGSEGTLYVLDALSASILVMSRPGVLDRAIGREGQGPAEFKSPGALQLTQRGDLEVVDRGNGRVQRVDKLGTYLSSRPLPPFGASYPSGLSRQGDVAVNTLGDSLLVSVTDSAGESVAHFLRAPATIPRTISMSAVRQEVSSGRVPGFFRNTVQPAFSPDGSLWIALLTDARIERWSRDGTRHSSLQLDEPEFSQTRREFFERYRDPGLRGLPALQFIADIYPTESACWVLLRRGEDDDAVVLRVSNQGERTDRWVFKGVVGANLLAVDEERSAVFLSLSPTAEVVEVGLPDSLR